jgi:hypothetical protein
MRSTDSRNNPDADGQSRDLAVEAFLFQGRQGMVEAGFAISGIKGAQSIDHR